MPKLVRSDSKGLVQETGAGSSGLTSIIEAELVADAANARYTIAGDASKLVIPANSIIRDVTVVVTTALAHDNGTIGLSVGTAAAGTQIIALDADSISGATATLAAGKGTSTKADISSGLGGAAALDLVADAAFSATARTLYPEVVPSAGAITAGKLRVLIEYMTLGTLSNNHAGV